MTRTATSLTQLLVGAGHLSPSALRRAEAKQRAYREAGRTVPLGQVLVEMGAVAPWQIREALAQSRVSSSTSCS